VDNYVDKSVEKWEKPLDNLWISCGFLCISREKTREPGPPGLALFLKEKVSSNQLLWHQYSENLAILLDAHPAFSPRLPHREVKIWK